MERLRRPRVNREAREAEIVEAAIRCVLQSGFHASSMDAIAREAGISVGMIYRYFSSKEAIIEAIVVRDLEELRSKIAESDVHSLEDVQPEGSGIARFVENQHRRMKNGVRLEIYAEAARNPKIEAVVQRAAKVERELIVALLNRYLPAGTAADDLAGRADVMRIIADGLLINGLYADTASIETLVPRLEATMKRIFGQDSDDRTGC